MLSRWWLLFFGIILTVFGIASLILANNTVYAESTNVVTGIIWLGTALIAFAVAILVKNLMVVRWTAGIIGGLYLAWGIVYLYIWPNYNTVVGALSVAVESGILIILGAAGLASAFVPANWLYHEEHEGYVAGTA